MPELVDLLMLIFVVLIIVTFVAAVGLFFLLVFIRKPKKNVLLFSVDGRQELNENEAAYFSYIKYDKEKNSIILKQSQVFSHCVVTLIVKSNGKVSMKRYNLTYNSGDLYCGIRLNERIDEFRVVLDSVDKTIVKHPQIDNSSSNNVTYGIIVALLFAATAFVYVLACSFLLNDEWPAYSLFYSLAAFGLVFIVIIAGGYFLGEMLSKKGSFQYERD